MAISGPDFSKEQEFRINLSGTQFSYVSPRHNHPRISPSKLDNKSFNLYDKNTFSLHPNCNEGGAPSRVGQVKIWTFYNRKFVVYVKDVGEITHVMEVISMKEFNSLFNANHFEKAVERIIFSHGESFARSGECRLNWRVENHNGTNWVAYENNSTNASGGMYHPCHSVTQTFYLSPISDEHLVCMYFTQVAREDLPELEQSFSELRNKVMSSTKIELSHESTRQKEEVESTFPGQNYYSSLSPYSFNVDRILDEMKAATQCAIDYGIDEFNALPTKKSFKIIDDVMKDNKEKRKKQIDDILESHLRFKK